MRFVFLVAIVMSVSLFIQNTYYVITLESQTLRGYPVYEAVREEINRRLNPLSGGVDWQQVKTHCEWLAKGPGIDLLMAGYWTVASLKIQGLSGLANGVELLNAIVSMLPKGDTKVASGRKDILEWVNARAVEELKALKPDMESLRALYRCERYCEQLHRMMEQKQPTHSVNFEGIGFALFEHIDRLETQLYTASKAPVTEVADVTAKVAPPSSWRRLGRFMSAGMLMIAAMIGAYQWFHYWQYFQFERTVDAAKLSNNKHVEMWRQPFIKTEVLATLETLTQAQFADIKKPSSQVEQSFERANVFYPEEVKRLRQQIGDVRDVAIKHVDERVSRFRDIRTNVANVALQYKGTKAYRPLHSLENYVIGLSPVYGRVAYIERLLKEGKSSQAREEFAILTQRLDDLNWKLGSLSNAL
ncbi:type VI secretion protein [Vibrio parahaemolyticus]|nr:type VI secretion protein [Vibrio parahaemolyticus]